MRDLMRKLLLNSIDITILLLLGLSFLTIQWFGLSTLFDLIISLLFALIIPGYVVTVVLFPGTYLTWVERAAYSFLASVFISGVEGFLLAISPIGLRYQPLFVSTAIILTILSIIALWSRYKDDSEPFINRLSRLLNSVFPRGSRFRKLDIAIALVAVFCVGLVTLVVVMQPENERYTEMVLLNEHGMTYNYPQNLTLGDAAIVKIGLTNLEGSEINYEILTWVIATSYVDGRVVVEHMWFESSNNISLRPVDFAIDGGEPQATIDISFDAPMEGEYRAWFLLFPNGYKGPDYIPNKDYWDDQTALDLFNDSLNGDIQSLFLSFSAEP